MPGNRIWLSCECGISSTVSPGAYFDEGELKSVVIIYDAEDQQFKSMDADEAQALGLKAFTDPYASMTKLASDVQAEIDDKGFWCPNCGEYTLKYLHTGNWD